MKNCLALLWMIWTAATAVATTEKPSVLTVGRYAGDYETIYRQLGCDYTRVSPEKCLNTDLSGYNLVHAAHWKYSREEAQKLLQYVRNGGTLLLTFGSFPTKEMFGTAVMPRAVEGKAGMAIDIDTANFKIPADVPPRVPYGGWGMIVYAAELPNVTVLANWVPPESDAALRQIRPEFKVKAPAMLRIKQGKGTIYYIGGYVATSPSNRILKTLINSLFPATDILKDFDREISRPVEVVKSADHLSGEKIAIFSEPGLPVVGMPADISAEYIATTLRAEGRDVQIMGLADLIRHLTPEKFNTLILAHGEALPLTAYHPIRRFLAGGGGLVSPAGVPLSRPFEFREQMWHEIGGGNYREQIAFGVFSKILPLGKYHDAYAPAQAVVNLAGEFLPRVANTIPSNAGSIGLSCSAGVSQRSLVPLLGSIDASGDLVAVNLSYLLQNRLHPASRTVLASFTGDAHPWAPRYGDAAKKLIGDMTALSLQRDMAIVGDLYTAKTTYRPGELAVVRGTLYGTRSGKRRVRISALPYSGSKPLAVAELELDFKAPGPLPFSTLFSIPADYRERRIDLFAEVQNGGMTTPQRAMIPVKQPTAPPMSEFRMTERYATLDGKALRLSGANLYGNERALGAFFDTDTVQKVPDIWEQEMAQISFTGGTAMRQHYLEKMLNEAVLAELDNGQYPTPVRVYDGYVELHAAYGLVPVLSLLTFQPNRYDSWAKRLNVKGNPYRDPSQTGPVFDYAARLAAHSASYRSIAWEIINEPESNSGKAENYTAADIRWWFNQVAQRLLGGKSSFAGVGNTYADASSAWLNRENLHGVAGWTHVHPYYNDAIDLDGKKNMAYVMNLGRPSLMGEVGMPNPGQHHAAKLGSWGYFYENLLALAIAENSLGLQNFYLANNLGPHSPEWGMLMPNFTEKDIFRRWKLWTLVCDRLPPDTFKPAQQFLLYHSRERSGDITVFNRLLSDTYLRLVGQGIRVEILSDIDPLPPRAEAVWLLHSAAENSWAAGIQADLHQRGIPVHVLRAETSRQDVIQAIELDRQQHLRDYQLPTTSFQYSYVLPQQDRGRTFLFARALKPTARLTVGNHHYECRIKPDSVLIISTDRDGKPQLIQATGSVHWNGKLLAEGDSREPFLLFSPSGENLENSAAVVLWADDPWQVRTSCRLKEALLDRLRAALIGASPEMTSRFAALLQERGGELVPAESADLVVRIQSGDSPGSGRYSVNSRAGIWPEIRDGERRLWQRWSAFLVPVGSKELHILATTPTAAENALRKVARLRQKLTYTTGPFALQSDRKE